MEEFEKIKTETIGSQVYEKIKKHIIEGTWKPGEKIPSESVLCSKLGVGRVSIRAALQSLSAQGYLETKRGEGSYVRVLKIEEHIKFLSSIIQITKKDALEVIEFRKIFEPNIMSCVIERCTDEDIKELEKIYETMVNNIDNSEDFAEADTNFHYYIAKITRNNLIESINNIIGDLFKRSMSKNIEIMNKNYAIDYHKRIIEAIKNKDKLKAKELMLEHLEIAEENITISKYFIDK